MAELLLVVIDSVPSDFPKDRRLVLVDTPGFGDTEGKDADILSHIGSWLATMYTSHDSLGHERETKLAGIVYLHDISISHMPREISNSLAVFRGLCGKDALKHVVTSGKTPTPNFP